uniref:Uncharacterized protein n=1 Tax=Anguilla anguilla TaxID=7936 RepID=A0A0E9RXL7_ANGAN
MSPWKGFGDTWLNFTPFSATQKREMSPCTVTILLETWGRNA